MKDLNVMIVIAVLLTVLIIPWHTTNRYTGNAVKYGLIFDSPLYMVRPAIELVLLEWAAIGVVYVSLRQKKRDPEEPR